MLTLVSVFGKEIIIFIILVINKDLTFIPLTAVKL